MSRPNLDEPWLVERSRALHAELSASPQDKATQYAIMDRHVSAAAEAHPEAVVWGEDETKGFGEARLLLDLAFATRPPVSADDLRTRMVATPPPEAP